MNSPSPLRTVVVDNDLDLLRVLTGLLASLGCEVQSCDNGADCIQLMDSFRPQLILLDLAMPMMSGLSVAEIIRREYPSPSPFLVAVTGYGIHDMLEFCKSAGFDRVALKPVSMERLQEFVDEGRRHATEQAEA